MAMSVDLPALEQTAAPRPASARWTRLARPVLGLLVPVVLALGWELIVDLGYSNGRLVPPPSKVSPSESTTSTVSAWPSSCGSNLPPAV